MPTNAVTRLSRWQADDPTNRFFCIESSGAGLTLHLMADGRAPRSRVITHAALALSTRLDILDSAATELLHDLLTPAQTLAR